MKSIFVLIIFIFIPVISIAQPSGWKLSRDANGVKVWLLKNNSNVTGSLQRRKTLNKNKLGKIKQEDFFKRFENKKRRILSLIGVTNWKATKYDWSPGTRQLSVEGTYTDSSGLNVTFAEIHIFKNGETVQILHTRPTSLSDGSKYEKEIVDYIKK